MKKILLIAIFLVSCAVNTKTDLPMTLTEESMPTLVSINTTVQDKAVIEKEYDSSQWTLIYNKGMVWQSEITPTQEIWINEDKGNVGFFNGKDWTLFSGNDYGFPDKPNDMTIALDGTVWVSGRDAISRYRNGHWNIFPVPNRNKTAFNKLAVDSSGMVWLATPLCYCERSLKKFNGTNWDELSVTDRYLEVSQILFASDGTLWASFGWPEGIGQYDGKTWKVYSGIDLWPSGPYSDIQIASDYNGNVYGVYEGQEWIISINSKGDISRIPFSSRMSLNPNLLRLFVDKQGVIWINSCLKDRKNSCLSYYRDKEWSSFVNLPFSTASDINELSNEILLVATEKGLYQYSPLK